jgi:membrane fusion protein, multidrug efflux system
MRMIRQILVNLILGIPVIAAAVTLAARGEQERQGQQTPGGGDQHQAQPASQDQQTPHQGLRSRSDQGGPVSVLVEAAKHTDVPVYLDGLGTIKALNTAAVRPQVDGQLLKILFREGQEVQRGYVLAEIDARTYQAQLDQTTAKLAQDQAQLANAKLDLDRYTRLVETNAGSKQQADTQRALVAQFEALLKIDQAAIDNANIYLGYTKVTAPFDGRTGLRQVDEGNLVHASDPQAIVVITQLKPISMYFNLPQQQLAQVNDAFAQGPLAVEALGSDGRTVIDRGTLKVVDNQVDQATGTVRMKAELPNADLKLWPGEFVNVRLLVETLKQALMVPTSAVQRGPNGTFVYVLKPDDSVSMRPVTVSQQDDLQAVIATGLEADEHVVTTGFARLADGTPVSVQPAIGSNVQAEEPKPAAIEHKDAGIRPPGSGVGGGHGGGHRHSDNGAGSTQ